VRSEHYNQYRSTSTLYMMLSKATKTELPSLYIQGIPLVTWIRALGCITDKSIYLRFRFVASERWLSNPVYEEYVYNCLENNQSIVARTDALVRIGKLSADKDVAAQRHNGMVYIKQKLLPHVGYEEKDFPFKIFALLDIACRLFDFVNDSSLKTDKDSYFNKRVESAEDLLGTLTRQLFASYLNSIKVNIYKRLEKKKSISVHEIFSDNKVSKGISDSLASGMWHATRDKVTQTGMFYFFLCLHIYFDSVLNRRIQLTHLRVSCFCFVRCFSKDGAYELHLDSGTTHQDHQPATKRGQTNGPAPAGEHRLRRHLSCR
jgi:DNA-directed RNA polymerase beta subunit